MEKGLEEKTGKPLEYWIKQVKNTRLEKHGEILKWLKTEHNFTHGYANFVSLKARESDAASQNPNDLITSQYTGKEQLLPLYHLLEKAILALGDDVKQVPKKDSISFIRKHQFALVKPATKTRIDLGLKIKDQEPTRKLEASGPFGAMCTHRIQLHSEADMNTEVLDWITLSYQKST